MRIEYQEVSLMTRTATPFMRDFVSLRDAVDRLFEQSFVSPERMFQTAAQTSRPMPLEIYETPDDIVVRALVPGVSPEALDVQYHQGVLTLRARTETPSAHDDWTWHLREFGYGEILRSISLPRPIEVDRAEASFTDGILTLRLPKSEQAKPRQIKIVPQAQLSSGETRS
jgi:HSP20 family protein